MGNEVGKGILGGSWPARGDLGYNWSLRAKFVDYIVEFTIVLCFTIVNSSKKAAI